MILTNTIRLSLWESSRFPYIKIQMPTGILWQTPKSLFQIVPPETFLPAKVALHSLSRGIYTSWRSQIQSLKMNCKENRLLSLHCYLYLKRGSTVCSCHGVTPRWKWLWDLKIFSQHSVIVQATYTHLQLLIPFFSCKERS